MGRRSGGAWRCGSNQRPGTADPRAEEPGSVELVPDDALDWMPQPPNGVFTPFLEPDRLFGSGHALLGVSLPRVLHQPVELDDHAIHNQVNPGHETAVRVSEHHLAVGLEAQASQCKTGPGLPQASLLLSMSSTASKARPRPWCGDVAATSISSSAIVTRFRCSAASPATTAQS